MLTHVYLTCFNVFSWHPSGVAKGSTGLSAAPPDAASVSHWPRYGGDFFILHGTPNQAASPPTSRRGLTGVNEGLTGAASLRDIEEIAVLRALLIMIASSLTLASDT